MGQIALKAVARVRSSEVLPLGVISFDEATGVYKIGDGVTVLSDLPEFGSISGDVAGAIADLVGDAPEALDKLNELAAALGDDPNFATTILNDLASKQPIGTYLVPADKGVADGVASLDDDVLVPDAQIPTTITRLAGPRPEVVADDRVFDVDPTGVVDSTTGLLAAATAAAAGGRRLIIPEGDYLITPGSLILPAALTVAMWGARLFATSRGSLVTLDDDVEIHGGEIEGAGAGTLDLTDYLIAAIGTVGARKSHMLLDGVYLHGSGAYGVRAEFVDDMEIRSPRVADFAYAGILGVSVSRVHVTDPDIDGGNPIGASSNAYGVSFTRSNGDSLVDNPRSSDCSVRGGVIRNIPIWTGLDTHAGERIKFTDFTVLNCNLGVGIGASKNSSSVDTFAPHNCSVDNYTIDSQVTDGSASYGITATGASGGEKARSLRIGSGTITGHGAQGTTAASGVEARDTYGLTVDGLVAVECSPTSLNLKGENIGFNVSFTSIDPWSTLVTVPRHFYLSGANNIGSLNAYSFAQGNKVAAYVGVESIRVNDTSGNELALGVGYMTTAATIASAPGSATPFVDAGERITSPVRRFMTMGSSAVALASKIEAILIGSATWDPGNLAAVGDSTSVDVSVTGARVGDPAVASLTTIGANSVTISAFVRSNDSVRVVLTNRTAGALDIASGTVRVLVFKQ